MSQAPTDDQLWLLSSFAGTFTLIEHAIQILGENPLHETEIQAMRLLSTDRQMRLTGRLMDLAEQLRSSLEQLDLQVLELTSGLHEVTES